MNLTNNANVQLSKVKSKSDLFKFLWLCEFLTNFKMEQEKNGTCDLYFEKLSSCTDKGKCGLNLILISLFEKIDFCFLGKQILDNVSGRFKGGSLIAILGPSGSGKTTFLNVLSGYRYQNATCESLKINGENTDFEHLASISCYLTQDIHLNDLLTVEENMRFAADFKLGVTHSQNEKNAIVRVKIKN